MTIGGRWPSGVGGFCTVRATPHRSPRVSHRPPMTLQAWADRADIAVNGDVAETAPRRNGDDSVPGRRDGAGHAGRQPRPLVPGPGPRRGPGGRGPPPAAPEPRAGAGDLRTPPPHGPLAARRRHRVSRP